MSQKALVGEQSPGIFIFCVQGDVVLRFEAGETQNKPSREWKLEKRKHD